MFAKRPTKLAVVPRNDFGTNPEPTTRGGRRYSTGCTYVRIRSGSDYRPPRGWRIAGIMGDTSGYTYIKVE